MWGWMPPSSASSSVPRRQLPYNQHNIHILNIITLWNFPILADLDKSYWMVGWMTTMIYIIAIFGGWEKKLLPNSNGDIKKYFSPATHWKKLLSSQICWKKYLSSIENTRPPPESQHISQMPLLAICLLFFRFQNEENTQKATKYKHGYCHITYLMLQSMQNLCPLESPWYD